MVYHGSILVTYLYVTETATSRQRIDRRATAPDMDLDALAEDWTVWNRTETELILAYRPDVFDSEAFPAPCLPTIYLTHGKRTRRPGADRTGEDWYVTLYLEPEVDHQVEVAPARDEAVAAAVALANEFAAGEFDFRALYQVPREAYLDELDELTGRA